MGGRLDGGWEVSEMFSRLRDRGVRRTWLHGLDGDGFSERGLSAGVVIVDAEAPKSLN